MKNCRIYQINLIVMEHGNGHNIKQSILHVYNAWENIFEQIMMSKLHHILINNKLLHACIILKGIVIYGPS